MHPVGIGSKMRSGDFVYGIAYTAIPYTIISDLYSKYTSLS